MKPKFLLDGMLGALARWLRICGYETKYIQNAPDEELLEKAAGEGLVLITRDRLLYRKAQRGGLEVFLVGGDDDVGKLASVSKRFHLTLDPGRSRCPNCDAILQLVNKEAIKNIVPSRTYKAYDDFWVCNSCGKVYWRGSHWKNIVETVAEASKLAELSQGDYEQAL